MPWTAAQQYIAMAFLLVFECRSQRRWRLMGLRSIRRSIGPCGSACAVEVEVYEDAQCSRLIDYPKRLRLINSEDEPQWTQPLQVTTASPTISTSAPTAPAPTPAPTAPTLAPTFLTLSPAAPMLAPTTAPSPAPATAQTLLPTVPTESPTESTMGLVSQRLVSTSIHIVIENIDYFALQKNTTLVANVESEIAAYVEDVGEALPNVNLILAHSVIAIVTVKAPSVVANMSLPLLALATKISLVPGIQGTDSAPIIATLVATQTPDSFTFGSRTVNLGCVRFFSPSSNELDFETEQPAGLRIEYYDEDVAENRWQPTSFAFRWLDGSRDSSERRLTMGRRADFLYSLNASPHRAPRKLANIGSKRVARRMQEENLQGDVKDTEFAILFLAFSMGPDARAMFFPTLAYCALILLWLCILFVKRPKALLKMPKYDPSSTFLNLYESIYDFVRQQEELLQPEVPFSPDHPFRCIDGLRNVVFAVLYIIFELCVWLVLPIVLCCAHCVSLIRSKEDSKDNSKVDRTVSQSSTSLTSLALALIHATSLAPFRFSVVPMFYDTWARRWGASAPAYSNAVFAVRLCFVLIGTVPLCIVVLLDTASQPAPLPSLDKALCALLLIVGGLQVTVLIAELTLVALQQNTSQRSVWVRRYEHEGKSFTWDGGDPSSRPKKKHVPKRLIVRSRENPDANGEYQLLRDDAVDDDIDLGIGYSHGARPVWKCRNLRIHRNDDGAWQVVERNATKTVELLRTTDTLADTTYPDEILVGEAQLSRVERIRKWQYRMTTGAWREAPETRVEEPGCSYDGVGKHYHFDCKNRYRMNFDDYGRSYYGRHYDDYGRSYYGRHYDDHGRIYGRSYYGRHYDDYFDYDDDGRHYDDYSRIYGRSYYGRHYDDSFEDHIGGSKNRKFLSRNANTNRLNGVWVQDGRNNGKPKYTNGTGHIEWARIYTNHDYERWMWIARDGSTNVYSNDFNSDRPPESSWKHAGRTTYASFRLDYDAALGASASIPSITVKPIRYRGPDREGHFLYELRNNLKPRRLYIFFDNLQDRNLSSEGEDWAEIRPFSMNSEGKHVARAAGICTGHRLSADHGFRDLTYDVRKYIDEDIREVRKLLRTGRFHTVVYNVRERGELATRHNVGSAVKRYIVKEIKSLTCMSKVRRSPTGTINYLHDCLAVNVFVHVLMILDVCLALLFVLTHDFTTQSYLKVAVLTLMLPIVPGIPVALMTADLISEGPQVMKEAIWRLDKPFVDEDVVYSISGDSKERKVNTNKKILKEDLSPLWEQQPTTSSLKKHVEKTVPAPPKLNGEQGAAALCTLLAKEAAIGDHGHAKGIGHTLAPSKVEKDSSRAMIDVYVPKELQEKKKSMGSTEENLAMMLKRQGRSSQDVAAIRDVAEKAVIKGGLIRIDGVKNAVDPDDMPDENLMARTPSIPERRMSRMSHMSSNGLPSLLVSTEGIKSDGKLTDTSMEDAAKMHKKLKKAQEKARERAMGGSSPTSPPRSKSPKKAKDDAQKVKHLGRLYGKRTE